jgi:beta-lactamase regulating signal transducer with metallopeptidase domain
MERIKNIISAQPLIALAIIVVLLLVVVFIGAKSGVQRFTKKKGSSTLDDKDERRMAKLINEIHDKQGL